MADHQANITSLLAQPKSGQPRPGEAPWPSHHGRVLAMADDSGTVALIQQLADTMELDVEITGNAGSFRDAVVARPPDAVLLDLQLPQADGIALLHALADAKCGATIFLIYAGDARLLDLARRIGGNLGLEMGMALAKPVQQAALQAALAGVRGKSHLVTPEALLAALPDAIARDELELFYQPIVALVNRQPLGLEALVRWRHPQYGIITPDRFIEIAEQNGLIGALTDRVLDLAARQLVALREAGHDVFIAVNLSAYNIDFALPDRMVALCAAHGIPHQSLRFEMTESTAMENQVLMREVLTRLRLKDFHLALDDFGTGYSSLVQLQRLPFSVLKIDRSFVRDMAHAQEAALIVKAIIGLGRSLRLQLVAEGIESEEVEEQLIALGCDKGQGFLYTPALPRDAVLAWLAERRGPRCICGDAAPDHDFASMKP
jgi:EAL domain-containing protein (putative c-di-GMP-specific phosphodiesterase class I)